MKSDSWFHLSPSDARGIYSKMYKQIHNRSMWRLILYASLIGLRHAQTWFLGASVSVYLEEISIWFRSLHQGILFSSVGRQLGAWREQNGGGRWILSSWAGTSNFSCPWMLEFLVLRPPDFGTSLGLTPEVPVKPLDSGWITYTQAFLVPQLVHSRWWEFPDSTTT